MRRAMLGMVMVGSVGCVQHAYSHDEAELDLLVEGEVLVDALVTTAPSAWPPGELYDSALRVGMTGEVVDYVGEVVGGEVAATDHEVNEQWGDHVNVLDAWRDCDRGATCARTFRFRVACAELAVCEGVFAGDVFLSTEELPHSQPEEGDGLSLSLTLATPATP